MNSIFLPLFLKLGQFVSILTLRFFLGGVGWSGERATEGQKQKLKPNSLHGCFFGGVQVQRRAVAVTGACFSSPCPAQSVFKMFAFHFFLAASRRVFLLASSSFTAPRSSPSSEKVALASPARESAAKDVPVWTGH